MYTTVAVVFAAFVALAAAQNPLYSVPDFNVVLYQGGWYEIATSQFVYQTFERNCVCVKANYTLSSDQNGAFVIVNNQCRRSSVTAPVESTIGRAEQENPQAPGELTVSFGFPASGPNYFVIEIGPEQNYGPSNLDAYVLVGEPSRRSLWILARRPVIDINLFNKLVSVATANGFDVEQIRFRNTVQDGCGWIY